MSKVRLTGSNSGYVEIAAAADAGNLTFTMPTSGTALLGNTGNVFSGITTTGQLDINGSIDVSSTSVFNDDVTFTGGSYNVLWNRSNNQLEFGDNAKVAFGGSSDLQIYHDSSDNISKIDNSTNNVLQIRNLGNNKIVIKPQNSFPVELYFNGNKKLETTNTGAIVTGICTATSFSGSGEGLTRTTPYSHRNLIMNGKADVFQRFLGGSQVSCNSGSNFYCMDRWYARGESSSGVFSLIQQDISSEGIGVPHAIRVNVTTNVTPAGGDVYKIAQRIEGKNIGHLSFGTSGAKTITLSFLVKSSVTGTHGGSLMNSAQNRSFPFTYTISSANTWEQKSITIPGDTGGTWLINTGIGLELNFDMGSGSAKRGNAGGAWIAARAEGANGTVQLISTSSANWYVTKVQIEEGSTATPFEHIPLADQLSRCQRYYYQHARGDNKVIGSAVGYQSNDIFLMIYPKVTMRAAPTLVQETGTNYYRAYQNGGYDMFNSWGGTWNITDNMFSLNANSSQGVSGPTGNGNSMIITSNANAYLAFDADL
tara:strand:+ start:825 stop:2438 length:1614 start_codon:yes stop_codon:yes gene_type:complete